VHPPTGVVRIPDANAKAEFPRASLSALQSTDRLDTRDTRKGYRGRGHAIALQSRQLHKTILLVTGSPMTNRYMVTTRKGLAIWSSVRPSDGDLRYKLGEFDYFYNYESHI
jgi:hypothetical protein